MASREPASKPADSEISEIDNDPLAESEIVEEPDEAPQPVSTVFPPADHRVEVLHITRPDGLVMQVTRDIDTGEQQVVPADMPSVGQ